MELLFERFLSEERGEWPDIDLDLPSGDHREEVIQYVYRRYGERGAGMTATVISYRTRSAVREVGKALGLSLAQVDRLAKLLRAHGWSDDHDELAAQLRNGGVDPEAPRIALLVELVQQIQGLPRHLGQHSGGMVIAAGRLDEVVPLEPATMPGRIVIQWDKDDCADLGLIKVDLLGLGMIQALEEAIPLVREHEGVALDLAHLPPDDPTVYAMLRAPTPSASSRSRAARRWRRCRACGPSTSTISSSRWRSSVPGRSSGRWCIRISAGAPGREPVTYAHPSLEPILKRTLGVPLFQEQLLRMAMAVAGFTGGEAEELRRAMGFKRSMARMRAIEQRLRAGMAARGITGAAQDEIVQSITSFALYGFPESHAASFALIAYASAYLKAHHPAAFSCALLNAWPMGFYHPATLVKDAQRHGVRFLPIDVTRSAWKCTIEDGAVRLGLRYVMGLRQEAAERLVAARPFASVAEVAQRGCCAGTSSRRSRTRCALAPSASRAATRSGRRRPSSATPPACSPACGRRRRRAPLPPMTAFEETAADYATTSLTAGPHVMTYLRAELTARGVLAAADLARVRDGAAVRVAGHVIVRQRPGHREGHVLPHARGRDRHRERVPHAAALRALARAAEHVAAARGAGPLEHRDGVTHVRALRLRRLQAPDRMPVGHNYA